MMSARCRLLLVLVLLSTLVGLISLAYASPPDAAWIKGFYDDDDDDDDVIAAVDSISSVIELGLHELVKPFFTVVAFLRLASPAGILAVILLSFESRAPPA